MTRVPWLRVASLALALAATASTAIAADPPWMEVKSAHFTVMSNASDGMTRTLAWQLEQVRNAIASVWPWMKVDLNRPIRIIAVKDEGGMKLLAPKYWEEKTFHPVSVWASGPDGHYLAIRADIRGDDTTIDNPHRTAYHALASMILAQTFNRRTPRWFLDGLAEVISNTLVRDATVYIGPPIGAHMRLLNDRGRLKLPQLAAVTRDSREMIEEERRWVYDAETWALVHFFMFGEDGAHQKQFGQYGGLLLAGKDPDTAFRETLGHIEDYEQPLSVYIGRSIHSYVKVAIDAGVKREGFTVRTVAPAEAAAERAAFHVAMRRPSEARAEIAAARKADPREGESYVAEGILLDREDKREDARAAFATAMERNSANGYAYLRFAELSWGAAEPDRATLQRMEQGLTRAVALNPRDADAYAYLGEVRAAVNERTETAVGVVRRAIALDPSEPRHHLSLAHVLYRLDQLDESRKEAQAALSLADTDNERQSAQRYLAFLDEVQTARQRRAQSRAAESGAAPARASETRPADANAAAARPAESRPAESNNAASPPATLTIGTMDAEVVALRAVCRAGDAAACKALLPHLERQCATNDADACRLAGSLYEAGRGVAADAARAARLYEQSCGLNDSRGCVGFAALQARGAGVPKDEPAALKTLEQACTSGYLEGCTAWAIVLIAHDRPADLAHARELLTRSCNGGSAVACDRLKALAK